MNRVHVHVKDTHPPVMGEVVELDTLKIKLLLYLGACSCMNKCTDDLSMYE